MDRIWLNSYQKGVVKDIDPSIYNSLPEMLLEACQKYQDSTAYLSMGTRLSFAELELRSRHLAAYLQKLNLAKGTRVSLILPNVLQYPISLLAVLRSGMVVVNTNPMYTSSEMTHQLQNAEAEVAIIFAQCIPALQQALPELPALKHIIVAEIGDEFPWYKRCLFNLAFNLKHSRYAHTIDRSVSFREAIKQGSRRVFQKIENQPEDIAFLQYTGGTTGVAKGAVLTHRNIVANVLQASAWIAPVPLNKDDLIVTALPLYHIFSLTANCLVFLHLGVPNLLIADPRRTKSLLKEIHKNLPTAITGVNTLFTSILNNSQFSAADFSHLKIALSGGMALNQAVAERWKAAIHHPIIEAYGLTEASPAVCINPLDHARQGSIGLPLPSTEISIRNEQGEECAIGTVGELCIRGPQIMQNYWHNPKETALVFYEDKFLRTGDSARIDEQGFIYLTDRIKDLIIVSGFNVYPHEVEEVIAQMDKVLEVGVIGVPSKSGNERIKACIVARDPSLTVEEVLTHCKQHLTSYKIPKVVEFYVELPKTNVGKILKRMLR
ncbi:MAG: AMP-binding protein [Gammaproteobacteria bacterium]